MQRATPYADSRPGLLALVEDRAWIAACGNSKESHERPALEHREQYLHFKVRMALGYLSSRPEEGLRVDTTHERQTNPKATPRIHARDKRAVVSAHSTLKGLETNQRFDFCVTSQKRTFPSRAFPGFKSLVHSTSRWPRQDNKAKGTRLQQSFTTRRTKPPLKK